jgi:group I intron endonuclease
MACGIYRITNTVNGKCYIGSAADLERREKQHFSGDRTNKILKQAMDKYGPESFKFEVLEECTTREMLSLEQLNIDLHRVVKGWENLYNICEVAGSRLGTKHSEESKKLISKAKKGKKYSEEHKRKISDAMKGDKNHNFGKQLNEEHKKAIGDSLKGNKHPQYDQAIYLFQHFDGRTFTGTQHELRIKQGLNHGTLSQVILGKRNHTGGWMLTHGPIQHSTIKHNQENI